MGESANGPWTKIVEGEFLDPSQEEDIMEFPLIKPQTGQFVSFRCVSWYGWGCLLQYIGFGLDFKQTGMDHPTTLQFSGNSDTNAPPLSL